MSGDVVAYRPENVLRTFADAVEQSVFRAPSGKELRKVANEVSALRAALDKALAERDADRAERDRLVEALSDLTTAAGAVFGSQWEALRLPVRRARAALTATTEPAKAASGDYAPAGRWDPVLIEKAGKLYELWLEASQRREKTAASGGGE